MKESRHNSGTSLFLMEMILALLFLSLSSAACIQIFAAARKNRLQAEQWNQIQALTTSVGEILEGTDGTDEQFLSLLPGGIKKNTNLIWYYDRNWQSCSSGEAACEMILKQIFLLQKNPASFLSGSFPTAVSFTGSPCVFLLMTTEGRLYIETEAYVFCNCRHSFPVSYLLCAVSLCTCSAYSWKLQIQS
ncbi:MAG: hypothetical protein ACLTQN_04710 [Blautia massiliensis (ex Durand et al. 2017)]